MILEFPASYCHLARGDHTSLLTVFFFSLLYRVSSRKSYTQMFHSFLFSVSYLSYYDIGVPCKLLPPCQGGSHKFTYCIFFSLLYRVSSWKSYTQMFHSFLFSVSIGKLMNVNKHWGVQSDLSMDISDKMSMI